MTRTRIKVCGITSVEDASKCLSLGADYLGVIFADSPRKVSMETARRIRTTLPQAKLVGVFMDSPLELVDHAVEACRLDLVQLHGRETPAYCKRLFEAISIPIIKSISLGSRSNGLKRYEKTSYFLFDFDKTSVSSSQSLCVNAGSLERLWFMAAWAAGKGYKIFLGGGLNPGNVRRGMEAVNPFCVDVCRGVEKSPGVKDEKLLKKFIAEVRK